MEVNSTNKPGSYVFSALLIAAFLLTLFPSCGIIGKSDSPPLVEDFELFYIRFHNDPAFQLSRINFPIDGGLLETHGKEEWTPENWPIMRVPVWDINDPDYRIDYKQTDTEFFQKIWIENSGFISEYHFKLIKGKWMLVYALEQNL